MSELSGLKALVTGGASGIGQATAALLAARGADVAVLDVDPSAVGGPLRGYLADVSDDASVRSAVATAAEDLGGVDIWSTTPASARWERSGTTTTPSGTGSST